MPTIQSITLKEEDNFSFIHLYKEGIFWKAYDHSAYLLCTQVRKLKVSRRVVKSCGGRVVSSVGFPIVHQEQTLPASLAIVSSSDNLLTLAAPEQFDAEAYADWCSESNGLPDDAVHSYLCDRKKDINSVKEVLVIDTIRNFDLANSTPLDALKLVNKLQQLLLSY